MAQVPMTDINSFVRGNAGRLKPQTAADATRMVGAIVDRVGYDSALGICLALFTSSSGNTTGKNTLLFEVYHDTAANMATEALLDSDTYEYTWVADGANDGVHLLPFSLESANRYIRIKAKLTEAGTITIASQQIGLALILGGQVISPDSEVALAGYEATTEPS